MYSLSQEMDPDALIEMDLQAEKLASSLFFRGRVATLAFPDLPAMVIATVISVA